MGRPHATKGKEAARARPCGLRIDDGGSCGATVVRIRRWLASRRLVMPELVAVWPTTGSSGEGARYLGPGQGGGAPCRRKVEGIAGAGLLLAAPAE